MEKMTKKIKESELPDRRRYLQRVLTEAISHAVNGEQGEAEDLAKEIVVALTGKKCRLIEE